MSRQSVVDKYQGEDHNHYFGLTDYTDSIPVDHLAHYRLWQCEPSGAWIETTTKTTDGLNWVAVLSPATTESLEGKYTLETRITNQAGTLERKARRVLEFTR